MIRDERGKRQVNLHELVYSLLDKGQGRADGRKQKPEGSKARVMFLPYVRLFDC